MTHVLGQAPPGLSGDLPEPDGTAPTAGARVPGPVGVLVSTAGEGAWPNEPLSGAARGDLLRGSTGLTFTSGTHTYRLRRVGTVWSSEYHEEPIAPAEARPIIDAAVQERAGDDRFVSLLTTGASQLDTLHQRAGFVLVRLRPRVASSAPAAATATSRPLPSRREPPASPPPRRDPEEFAMPADVAAAQAATLKTAAESGVPFCEECARAAAGQGAAAAT